MGDAGDGLVERLQIYMSAETIGTFTMNRRTLLQLLWLAPVVPLVAQAPTRADVIAGEVGTTLKPVDLAPDRILTLTTQHPSATWNGLAWVDSVPFPGDFIRLCDANPELCRASYDIAWPAEPELASSEDDYWVRLARADRLADQLAPREERLDR